MITSTDPIPGHLLATLSDHLHTMLSKELQTKLDQTKKDAHAAIDAAAKAAHIEVDGRVAEVIGSLAVNLAKRMSMKFIGTEIVFTVNVDDFRKPV